MGEEYPEQVGLTIRQARTKLGMSVRLLATRAGVSAGYISQLENGRKLHPSRELLEKFAEILKIEPSKLGIKPFSLLPEPREYFLRKMGISEDEADLLAGLIEHQLRKREEEKREDPG